MRSGMFGVGVDLSATLDDVVFVRAGTRVKGDFHCSDCGHRLASYRMLGECPACGSQIWEPAPWSPFVARGLGLPSGVRARTAARSPATRSS